MAMGKREKHLLGLLAGMGLLAAFYFGYNWYSKQVSTLTSKRDAAASELAHVKEKVRNLDLMRQRIADARQLQADLEVKVPKEDELPQLLRDLANMVALAGVKLKSFRPGKPEASTYSGWNQIQISINVSGSYNRLIAMFTRLQNARRLIGITDFTVTKSGGDDANPDLTCTMNLLVYFTK